jgi:hypothetical protein
MRKLCYLPPTALASFAIVANAHGQVEISGAAHPYGFIAQPGHISDTG